MPSFGDFTLHKIETGRFRLDGGAMFGVVPKPLWERHIPADDQNRIPLAMRCLLVETGDRLVLIDNGLGDKYDAKFADHFAVDYSDSELHASLRAAGFDASDVTDVVLTHLHFDHCGGTTTRDGDGFRLVFPNATHHVQRDHWDWANNPNARERASFLRENLAPLGNSGKLNLLDGEQTLLPGLDLIVVNGHTRGQQLVRLTGDDRTMVFCADLLPTATHLPLPWVMAYDVAPLDTLAEKEPFLKEAAERGWTLFFEHDAETEIAEVAYDGRRFAPEGARPFSDL